MRAPQLRRQALLGATMAALVPLLLRMTSRWHFHTNDDAQMFAIVSGHDGGTPSPQLVWQHPLVGELLVTLTSSFPGIAWYGWWLHGLLALGTAVALASLLMLLVDQPSPIALIAVLPVLASTVVFTVALQFTVVALTLGFAAVLSWLAITVNGAHRRWYALPTALFALAAMTRVSSAIAALGFGVLLAGAVAVRRGHLPRARTLTSTGVIALAIVGAVLLPWAEGTSDDVAETGYDLRMRVAPGPDFPDLGEREAAILQQVGWSDNDLALFNAWFRADHEVFTENLSTFFSLAWAAGPSPSVGSVLSGLPRIVTGQPQLWALLVAALLLGRAVGAVDRRGLFLASAYAVIALLLLATIQGVSRLPLWVGLPLTTAVIAGSLLVAFAAPSGGHGAPIAGAPRTGRALIAGLAIVLVAQATVAQVQALASERSGRAERSAARLDELTRLDVALGGDTVILTWLLDTWTHLDPLVLPAERAVPIVPIEGWNYPTAYRRAQLESLGLTDPYPALADDPRVLIVAKEERIELLRIFLAEHRGLPCRSPNVIGMLEDGISLVVDRFVQVPCATFDTRG